MDRTNDIVLSQADVLQLCAGKSRAWLYKQVAAKKFPAGFSLGARSKVWWRSTVIEYLENCESQADEYTAKRSAAAAQGREKGAGNPRKVVAA